MRFLQAWDPAATHGVSWGRRQLQRLARRSALGIADSRFNQLDLEAAGFTESVVVPVLIDLASSDHDVDELLLQRLRDAKGDGGRDWLFVGRIAPNKCQHDLVAALAAHRRAYGSHTRLHLVGGSTSATYSFALERFVAALGLEDAVEITGPVSAGALGAYYRAADVLVCVSEHEGFCVPVIEAMYHDVPVVAFAAGAVAETVGAPAARSSTPGRRERSSWRRWSGRVRGEDRRGRPPLRNRGHRRLRVSGARAVGVDGEARRS